MVLCSFSSSENPDYSRLVVNTKTEGEISKTHGHGENENSVEIRNALEVLPLGNLTRIAFFVHPHSRMLILRNTDGTASIDKAQHMRPTKCIDKRFPSLSCPVAAVHYIFSVAFSSVSQSGQIARLGRKISGRI